MKSTIVILAAIAVPMAVMALQIDGELISLVISSGVALMAMVIGLVAFLWTRPVLASATIEKDEVPCWIG